MSCTPHTLHVLVWQFCSSKDAEYWVSTVTLGQHVCYYRITRFRSQGTPGKISLIGGISIMSLTMVVISGKNGHLHGWLEYTLADMQLALPTGGWSGIMQEPSDGRSISHSLRNPLRHCWRNPRVPWNPGLGMAALEQWWAIKCTVRDAVKTRLWWPRKWLKCITIENG